MHRCPGRSTTRRRPARERQRYRADRSRSPAGRVTADGFASARTPAGPKDGPGVLLARSHLTCPTRTHSLDRLLSRVPPRYVARRARTTVFSSLVQLAATAAVN